MGDELGTGRAAASVGAFHLDQLEQFLVVQLDLFEVSSLLKVDEDGELVLEDLGGEGHRVDWRHRAGTCPTLGSASLVVGHV